jgi:hypothetical protein
MAKRGAGYGSEDHLIRYWTDQRAMMEGAILNAVSRPGGKLEWVYPSATDAAAQEPEGLAFLSDSPEVLAHWKQFWPQTGTQQCWDGVAWVPVEQRH